MTSGMLESAKDKFIYTNPSHYNSHYHRCSQSLILLRVRIGDQVDLHPFPDAQTYLFKPCPVVSNRLPAWPMLCVESSQRIPSSTFQVSIPSVASQTLPDQRRRPILIGCMRLQFILLVLHVPVVFNLLQLFRDVMPHGFVSLFLFAHQVLVLQDLRRKATSHTGGD